ncbi:MAG: TadE/TadG family type IV pilus assembly protein [Actinomycetes bacterium]
MNDQGNSTVDFALVAPLLVGVVLVVLQVALTLHVRSTLTAAAGEGARMAAMVGADSALGEQRAREVLVGNFASSVITQVRVQQVRESGLVLSQVTIQARLPLLGLLGPAVLEVTGRAIQEHA